MITDKEKLYQEIIGLYDEYRWTSDILDKEKLQKRILEAEEILALYDKNKRRKHVSRQNKMQ